jgi:hypothetical protein
MRPLVPIGLGCASSVASRQIVSPPKETLGIQQIGELMVAQFEKHVPRLLRMREDREKQKEKRRPPFAKKTKPQRQGHPGGL